jgi:integrase/recombinase XerD
MKLMNLENVQSETSAEIINLNNLSRYSSDFLSELDIKENSRASYKRALSGFFLFMLNLLEQPTSRDILAYKVHLKIRGLSAYTINSYIVVVRKFFEWTESKKIYPNIAKTIKGMKSPRGFRKECLTFEQIRDTVGGIDKETEQGKRDLAIISVLLRTGLRTIEIQRADIGDISQAGGQAKLYIQGKGRDSKDDFVVLTEGALKPLYAYLKTRGNTNDSDPLFSSVSDQNRGERMTTRSLSRLVKIALNNANINNSKLTAHSFRHTAITTALLAGASLQEVKNMARHSNINTTLIYSHNIDRIVNAPEHKIDNYYSSI